MHVGPDMVEAAYSFLLTTPPFRGWRLPPADDVEFCIMRTNAFYADYIFINGRHRIRISHTICRTVSTLIVAVAHEMVHVKTGMAHGAKFKRAADTVCKQLGFDRGTF